MGSEYERICALCERVAALLDEADASHGDSLHVAAYLTTTALRTLDPADVEDAMKGYFAAVAATMGA